MLPPTPMIRALGKLKMNLRPHKALLFTILASILLHLVLLSGFSISLPQIIDDQQTLKMHLVKTQRHAISKTGNPKPAKPEQAHKPAPDNLEPANKTADATDKSPVNAAANNVQADTEPAKDIDNSGNIENTGGVESTGAVETINATTDSPLPDDESKVIAYTHVEAEFDVTRGGSTSVVGITKTVFNIDASRHYSISSSTQAKGLAALFLGDLVQKSEGTVTEDGLKPDFYSYQYGSDAKKSQTANFAWVDGILHMHTYKGNSTAHLVNGSQDLLSFMYQFMFKPPLDTMQITMTNGKRLRTYTYSFEGEETITTKLGQLNTIHLLKSSGDEERTEIWLAADYQYLPVKIRKTEKDGTVIEQVITSIQTKLPD